MPNYRNLHDILGDLPPEEALIARGCALFPLNMGAARTAASSGFEAFLKMPPEDRARWTLGDPLDPDEGYLPRMGQAKKDGGRYDQKHAFHSRPTLLGRATEAGIDTWPHLHWLNGCGLLYTECVSLLHDIVKLLDRRLPRLALFDKVCAQEDTPDGHVLRLLHYTTLPIEDGIELGQFHIDRDFLTIHVAESHPGLILRTTLGDVLYRAQAGMALAFFGQKAESCTNGALKAMEHGIVAVKNGGGSTAQETRRSIVFFSHIPDQPIHGHSPAASR